MIGGGKGKRKSQSQAAVVQFNSGQQFERHNDFLSRTDVPDCQIDKAIAILMGEGRDRARLYSLLVYLCSFLDWAKFGINGKPVTADSKSAEASVAGENEAVDYFNRLSFAGNEFMANPESRSHRENLACEP
jgi:hypothetical protein